MHQTKPWLCHVFFERWRFVGKMLLCDTCTDVNCSYAVSVFASAHPQRLHYDIEMDVHMLDIRDARQYQTRISVT